MLTLSNDAAPRVEFSWPLTASPTQTGSAMATLSVRIQLQSTPLVDEKALTTDPRRTSFSQGCAAWDEVSGCWEAVATGSSRRRKATPFSGVAATTQLRQSLWRFSAPSGPLGPKVPCSAG